MRFDTIWLDARLATLAPSRPGFGIVSNGAVAAKAGRLVFAGPMAELPADWDAQERVALDGRWMTPGVVDCHLAIWNIERPAELACRIGFNPCMGESGEANDRDHADAGTRHARRLASHCLWRGRPARSRRNAGG